MNSIKNNVCSGRLKNLMNIFSFLQFSLRIWQLYNYVKLKVEYLHIISTTLIFNFILWQTTFEISKNCWVILFFTYFNGIDFFSEPYFESVNKRKTLIFQISAIITHSEIGDFITNINHDISTYLKYKFLE